MRTTTTTKTQHNKINMNEWEQRGAPNVDSNVNVDMMMMTTDGYWYNNKWNPKSSTIVKTQTKIFIIYMVQTFKCRGKH